MRYVILHVAILSVMVAAAVQARPITYNDLYSIPRAHSARISPDGQQIAFVLKTMDPFANKTENHIWLMAADGSGQRMLTDGDGESEPRWSDDGQVLWYLADHEGTTQIWQMPLGGDKPQQPLTNLPHGVDDYYCDGSSTIIAISTVYPECADDSCQRARLAQEESNEVEARLYDHLMVRHYNHWDDGRVNRPYLVDPVTGHHRPLYTGPHHAPTAFLDGNHWGDVSPDGSEITIAMTFDSMPALWPNNDLYTIARAGAEPTQLTDGPGLETSPRYSPDGRFLAFYVQARAGYESDQRDLVVYDFNSGTHRNLTSNFDRSLGNYLWEESGRAIWFTAIDRGFSNLNRVDLESGLITTALDDAVYSLDDLSPDGRYLLVRRTLADQPGELFRYDINAGKLTQLTHFTDVITSALDLAPVEQFWFEGFNGDSVHGFMIRPPDFDPAQRYPLVLLIHGGPQWCWLADFNYYGWNTQLIAAQGYVVAQINPHGSLGYGQAFMEYVSGNWGKGDYEDLMLGVDYLLAEHSFLDSTRLAALGRSYGGFMTNWICGHSDRFKCLITIDGTCNQISEYGTTEELWFPEWEAKGTPYDNHDEYWRSSPVAYAANFKTPTMVIHGQRDYRVDVSEALQMFTALQRQGVPSQLLYFPDEGHSIRKLKNLRVVYEHQLAWLARWLD